MKFNKFLNWLSDDGIYVPMIGDHKRNQFYDFVFSNTVKNKHCIDVGFGTGMLAVIACHHGARYITAFEQDADRYELGKWIIKKLGLENKVKLFCETFDPAKHIDNTHDLLYHELIGQDLWDQNLFLILNNRIETLPDTFICDFKFVPLSEDRVKYEAMKIKTSPLYKDIRNTKDFDTGLPYTDSFRTSINELLDDYKLRMNTDQIFDCTENHTKESYNQLRNSAEEILLRYCVNSSNKTITIDDKTNDLDFESAFIDLTISNDKLKNKFGLIVPQFKFGWNNNFYNMEDDTSWEIPNGIIFINDVKDNLNLRVYLKPVHSIGAYKSIRYYVE